MDVRSDTLPVAPDGFHLPDVSVRLARFEERTRWDRLMDQHHHLGFKRFVGRGIRYVFEWRGQWVGLVGWQSGAFRCRPRDQWIGWTQKLRFTRQHLIANNTRFLILGAPGCFRNLASFALAAMVRRLSDDWSAAFGHSLLLAETFVDPSKFGGHMYKAAGWTLLGRTKGYARAIGRYTDPHGVPKDLYVFPLHHDTRSRMCAPDDFPDPLLPNPMGDASDLPPHRLSSVYEELLRVPDFRRAQGRKHTIATIFAIVIAARLAGFESGIGAAQFARALNQIQLKAIGAWFNPKTKKYEPPSKSVLYRVREKADPAAIETVLKRWSIPRLKLGSVLAADGKRLRGANRNGDDHFETATLVAHDTGLPVASHGFHDENGERAAIAALFEEVSLAGHVITVDALHTTRDTARSIVESHNADYLMTVKANAPKTFETLSTINWKRDATGAFEEEPTKKHGRIDCRRIQTMTPLRGTVNYPHLSQIYRIERERELCKTGKKKHRNRLRHHFSSRGTGHNGKLACMEPRSLVDRKPQPSGARRQLQRGCLPQPHDAPPQQRCNLQLHRARDHLQAKPQHRRNDTPLQSASSRSDKSGFVTRLRASSRTARGQRHKMR